jgi:predicted aconitase with swiveling domain
MKADIILPGRAEGIVLRLDGPLSFWGGVDPYSGALTDPRSPHHGARIGGAILMVPETRGSSSSSAVMLELLSAGLAPAAIVMGRLDAILGLGILVAREMGWHTIPLLVLPPADQMGFSDGERVAIAEDGTIGRI